MSAFQGPNLDFQVGAFGKPVWHWIATLESGFGRQMPLITEDLPVPQHGLPVIDTCALESLAARMMNENLSGNSNPKSGDPGADTQIVIFEIPRAEGFIQAADLFKNGSTHEQAKPNRARRFDGLAVMRLRPGLGESGEFAEIAVRYLSGVLWAGNIIRHRTDDAGARILFQHTKQTLKP